MLIYDLITYHIYHLILSFAIHSFPDVYNSLNISIHKVTSHSPQGKAALTRDYDVRGKGNGKRIHLNSHCSTKIITGMYAYYIFYILPYSNLSSKVFSGVYESQVHCLSYVL